MINSDKPIAFFDLETTGLDKQNDRIVEISIVIVDGFYVLEPKTYLINPEMHIPETASAVHGITDENVSDCPTFKEIAAEILAIVNSCHIAGFNSNSYDIPLLYNELQRAGYDWDYSECKFIDVGNLYKIMEPRTLEAAYRFYCESDYPDAHSAQADVFATIRVFKKMQERYPGIPDNIDELSIFSNYGKRILDLSGRFTYNDENHIVFNFGKHRNELAVKHLDYLTWMLQQEFPQDTKRIIYSIINQKI